MKFPSQSTLKNIYAKAAGIGIFVGTIYVGATGTTNRPQGALDAIVVGYAGGGLAKKVHDKIKNG